MANALKQNSALAEEFLAKYGRDVIKKMFYGFSSAALFTKFEGVVNSLTLAKLDVVKSLIKEYSNQKGSTADAFEIGKIILYVSQFKTEMEFELNSDTYRGFAAYLKGQNKTTNDMHVLEYLMEDGNEARLQELEIAAWQGKEISGTNRDLVDRINGFREQTKINCAAGRGTVVATGAIDITNAREKIHLIYKAANSRMRRKGFQIFCNDAVFDAYCEQNYKDSNVAEKMIPVGKTGYMGLPIHLGAGKTTLVPIEGFGEGDAVMATCSEWLAMGFEYESRMNDWKIQEDGWMTWIANAFDLGFVILQQRPGYLICNDRLMSL